MLLEDCQAKAEELSYKIAHNIPENEMAEKQMNYYRGRLSVFEDLLGLAQELKEWKEAHK